eukprot:2892599-Prymnesium_polylepis.1
MGSASPLGPSARLIGAVFGFMIVRQITKRSRVPNFESWHLSASWSTSSSSALGACHTLCADGRGVARARVCAPPSQLALLDLRFR